MKQATIGLVVGLVLGGTIVGAYSHSRHQRELSGIFFDQGLADVVTAALTLRMIDEGRVSTARKINQTQLDSSIDSAYRWMVEFRPAPPPGSAPNIQQGLVDLHADLAVRQPERRETLWLGKILAYIQEGLE